MVKRKKKDNPLSFFCADLSAAKGGGPMRTKITLACTDCKQRNYNTTKEKKNHPDRMETKKFCKFCSKHTLHRETR
jgi:large subunit ribosomal protein L33